MNRKSPGSEQSSTAEYGACLSAQMMEDAVNDCKYSTYEMALVKGNTSSPRLQHCAYYDKVFTTIPIHK